MTVCWSDLLLQKTLTVHGSVFENFALGEYSLYAKNDGGITKIPIRIIDPTLAITPPKAVGKTVYNGSGDLIIEINLSGSLFSRFYGNGIARSDYSFTQSNGKNYITISESYLKKLSFGDYVYKIVSVNANDDSAEGEITVTIGSAGKDGKKGCGAYLGVNFMPTGLLLCGIALYAIVRRKENGNHAK